MNNSQKKDGKNSVSQNYFKHEITLKFNIENSVSSISNIKKWEHFSEKDFLNKSIDEIFEGDVLTKYVNSIKLVKNGNIEHLNYQHDNYNYQVLLSPYYKAAKYDGFIAIISRIKKTDNFLNYNEDYFSIFDDNKKCIVIYQAENNGNDFIIVSFNDRAEKLEKISKYDVVGKNVVEVFPRVKVNGLLDVFKRVLTTEKSEKHKSAFYKDKSKEGYRENAVYKFSKNKIIEIYDDITEKKELEDKLNTIAYEFNLVDNLSTEGIIFVKGGVIIKLNQKAINIFGYDNDKEIIGTSIYSYVNSKYKHLIDKYGEDNSKQKFNVSIINKGNNYVIIEVYSKTITDDFYGTITIFYIKDVTKEIDDRKKLKLLSTAVEQSANSVVITDKEGNIEYVNPYFAWVTGYTTEEVIGKNTRILKSGIQDDEFYKELWDTISDGKVWNGIFNNITKDGRSYWEKSTITPIINSTGIITNYIAIKENITKEYLQEISLISSERKYRKFISQATVPIVVIGYNGEIVFVNESMYKLIGIENRNMDIVYNVYTDSQLISNKVTDAIKKIFDGETLDIPLIKYDLSKIKFLENKRNTNNTQYLKANAFPVKDDKGNITQAVIMLESLNERKLHELTQNVIHEIIKESSRAESIAELVKIIKIEIGQLIDTTNFFVGLYNKETDSFYSPYFSDQKDKFSEFPAANTLSKYVIDNKKPLFANKEIKSKLISEGKIKTIGAASKIWLGVPLIVNDEAIGVYAIQNYENEKAYSKNDIKLLEIIGEQISMLLYKKQIEDNIKKQNIRLEAINKELTIEKEKAEYSERLTNAFLANMSHEIRTPMNGIIGFTQLLQLPDIDKNQTIEYAQVIEQSGNRLLNIIDELLDISKIEANKMAIKKTKYNLNNQLIEIYRFFKLEAENKHIDLIYNLMDGVEFIEVYTDDDKLQAILTNLIKNAIKYTKKGKVEFGFIIHKNEIEFYVSDTGIGIPENRQKAIFDRFVQADIEDRDVYEGAGLGLSITQAYVKMLDGEIKLKSTEGKGSKFTVILPMEIPDDIYNKYIEAVKKEELKVNKKDAILPINTLIVDDEKISHLYLSIALEDICEPMHYAQNAKEALEIIEENNGIDLILMDIRMPDMDGYELTKIIKVKYPEIKVIAQTAFALQGDRQKALDAGCDEYVSKPVNHKVLKNLIKVIFSID